MKAARPGRLPASCLLLAALLAPACQRQPQFGYDFERDQVLDELVWTCRTLLRLSPEHAASGARSLEIAFHPAPGGLDENYPGVSFAGFDPDWSGSRTLALDAFNPEAAPLAVTLRIDDRKAPDYPDRFNRTLRLDSGPNRISLPIGELVTSGTNRPLDRRRIRTVMLFLANPAERHTLYLDRVRLE